MVKNIHAYETNLIQPMTILNKRYLLCIASIFFCIFFVSGQEEVKIKPIKANNKTVNANCFRYGEKIDCNEAMPLFKVQPIYPRRAQNNAIEGWAVVKLTITESGSVIDPMAIEGFCGDPEGPQEAMQSCSIFNKASEIAASKMKYKPKIVDGKAVPVPDVLHRFTFIMAKD